jgi:hypothetical protein
MRGEFMRILFVMAALGALACQERRAPSQPVASDVVPAPVCPDSGETVQIEAEGPTRWRLRIDACFGTASGRGEVRVSGDAVRDGSPAFVLARARAWKVLAGVLQGTGRFDEALIAVRRGLAALGDQYAAQNVVDDTALKVAAAEELIKAGRTGDAVTTLLRVVDVRLKMFRDQPRTEGLE